MLRRLPPGAVDSVQRLALSTMENSELDHVRMLESEARRMALVLSSVEFYYWQETLRTLITPDHCQEILNFRAESVDNRT